MTNILFITSTRIGDAILSTGLIHHINKTYSSPQLTIVCGALPQSLFEAVPNLDELIPLKKQKYHGHWFWLWRKTITKKWDVIVDLRDSIISRLLPAKEKYTYGRHIDKTAHKVIQNAQVMKLDYVPSPILFLSKEQKQFADRLVKKDEHKIIGVGPTANWIGKMWPADRFIEIIHYLTSSTGSYPDARVAVFAAPGEERDAEYVLNTIPLDRQINVIAKGNSAEAAACLALCDLYIGNDSGLMHAAATAQIKTFGLFGASYASIYAPYGEHTSYAHTPETFDELINFEGYSPKTLRHSLMISLTTEEVIKKLNEFLLK
jgi:heptosyltransferase III